VTRNAANGRAREPRRAGIRGDRQVTSVQEYVLGDEHGAADLEGELDRLVRSQRTQKGLDGQVVLRSLDQPGAYLHLSCWNSPEHLYGAHHTDDACARFHRLGRLADIAPGQAVTVGMMQARLPLCESRHALLVRVSGTGPASALEVQFGELVGQFLHDPGFGGGGLLRSTLDPRAYLGLIWWRSARSCDDALSGDRFGEHSRQLQRLTSRLTFEHAQIVAEPS
jgi:hypothetical protein